MAKVGFPLGRTVATPGAREAFTRSGETPLPYLAKHANGNWGELDEQDKTEE